MDDAGCLPCQQAQAAAAVAAAAAATAAPFVGGLYAFLEPQTPPFAAAGPAATRGGDGPAAAGPEPPAPVEGGAAGGSPLDTASLVTLLGLTSDTCECANETTRQPGTPCSSPPMQNVIERFAQQYAQEEGGGEAATAKSQQPQQPPPPAAPEEAPLLPTQGEKAPAIAAAAAALGVGSESEILTHPTFMQYVIENRLAPPEAIAAELDVNFKAEGPRDSTALLSNYNIDHTLQRWARKTFPDFFACPFAMMDFAETHEPFDTIDMVDVLEGREPVYVGEKHPPLRRPNRTFGCVANTDTSSGPGKHWVAVFVDCRGGPAEPWTVEYFNSTGRPPPKPMARWMEKTRARLAEYREKRGDTGGVQAVPVTDMDHQQSQTECGAYSLYYIRRRLEGVPAAFFYRQLIPDDAMTEFRKHLFRRGGKAPRQ